MPSEWVAWIAWLMKKKRFKSWNFMCEYRFAMLNENRQLNRVQSTACDAWRLLILKIYNDTFDSNMKDIYESIVKSQSVVKEKKIWRLEMEWKKNTKKSHKTLSTFFMLYFYFLLFYLLQNMYLKLRPNSIIQNPHDSLQLFFSHWKKNAGKLFIVHSISKFPSFSFIFVHFA
jgi:hypothetical protein